MNNQDIYTSSYVIFALFLQVLLIGHFAVRVWRPGIELQWGWLVYLIAGLPALALGILFIATRQPWHTSAALLIFFVWAAFGYAVDILQAVDWRGPPIMWSVFIPYVVLFIGSLLALWAPLWFIGRGYWNAYAVMYAMHTTLNIYSHFKSG